MNIINTMSARMNYELALDMLREAGFTEQNSVLTQQYIRSEMLINANVTQYKVPLLTSDTATQPFNTEHRLVLQDALVLTELFIGLAVPTGASDAAFELLTYPDPSLFTTTGAARSAQTLYNGYLQIMVNQNNILPFWDISRHFVRNQTQAGVIITAQTVAPFNQLDLSTDGFYPVQPMIVHVGSKNIQATINLPAAISTVQANSRIVVISRGLTAQNSTSVK